MQVLLGLCRGSSEKRIDSAVELSGIYFATIDHRIIPNEPFFH
ncbi:hypothetical protein SynA1562_00210 [Synechococcus sp. A15-62]|nr:hypothetical protein SynA1562_00210 [Synechococcus sp. A15-62]